MDTIPLIAGGLFVYIYLKISNREIKQTVSVPRQFYGPNYQLPRSVMGDHEDKHVVGTETDQFGHVEI